MILSNVFETYMYIYIYIIGFITSDVPVIEMSTRNISFSGKGGRCLVLTNLPASSTASLEIWEPQPSGNLRVCPGLLFGMFMINPLNAKLNPICHLLALLGGATIVVVSRLRVKIIH